MVLFAGVAKFEPQCSARNPLLFHHSESAKARLYSLGCVNSIRLVDNGQYSILNRLRISRLSEIEIVRKRLLNVQYQCKAVPQQQPQLNLQFDGRLGRLPIEYS